MSKKLIPAIVVILMFIPLFPLAAPVQAAEPQKISVLHFTSFTGVLKGEDPGKLQIDRRRGELYVASAGNKVNNLIIVNEDGMPVYNIALKMKPTALCLKTNGDIFLSYSNDKIDILNYRGENKGQLDLSSVPDADSITVQSLHCSDSGELYIGESQLSRVIVLDSAGNFLYQFGKKGYGEGEFLNAVAIVTDADRIYLLDTALFRVSVFKKGGDFLFMFGRMSSLLGGFSMAVDMDTDGERLFVVDANRFVVIVFDKKGNPITEFGGMGQHSGSLSWPVDVKVDGKGTIFVSDRGNKRIQVFRLITQDQ